MLRCPKCNRTYQDEMQKFCTHDGGRLMPDMEKAKAFDPNATVHANASNMDIPSNQPSAPPQAQDMDATITGAPPSAPSTSSFRSSDTAPTSFPETTRIGQGSVPPPNYPPAVPVNNPPPASYPPPLENYPPVQPAGQSDALPPPGSAPLSPPSAPLQSQSAPLQTQSAPLVTAPGKSKFKLMIGIVGALVLIIIVGGAVAGYFIFIKEKSPRRGRGVTEDQNLSKAANTNADTPLEGQPKVVEVPAGTVKFENSASTLDGNLAANYVDFYFFYPEKWGKGKTAGVPGAANFVDVERKLPPDFTQEKLVVSWYKSLGTVEADLAQRLPDLIKERNSSLAKVYPEYEKVSEGKTTINGIDGYEFRFKAVSRGTDKGDIYIWGRVVFLPPGDNASTKGVTLYMLTTSLAPELKGIGDVGAKGELPVILNSFTLGKS